MKVSLEKDNASAKTERKNQILENYYHYYFNNINLICQSILRCHLNFIYFL